jgi:hypothetical protein
VSKLIAVGIHQQESSEVVDSHIQDFHGELSPLLQKMRGEHVKALCLAIVGLDPHHAGVDMLPFHRSPSVKPMEACNHFDIGLDAEITERLLTGIVDALRQAVAGGLEGKKTAVRSKTKSLISKPDNQLEASASDKENDVVAFVQSLLAHNSMRKVLPVVLHEMSLTSYLQSEGIANLVAACLQNREVDVGALKVCVTVLEQRALNYHQIGFNAVTVAEDVFGVLLTDDSHPAISFEDCCFLLRKIVAIVSKYQPDDTRFQQQAVTSALTVSNVSDRKSAISLFERRLTIVNALQIEFPGDTRIVSAQSFFQTNLYLMSDEIFDLLRLPFNGSTEVEAGVGLPWRIDCFESRHRGVEIVAHAIDHLKREASRTSHSAPRNSARADLTVSGAIIRLLRMWSVLHSPGLSLGDFFHRWSSVAVTGREASAGEQAGKGSGRDGGVDACYMSLLELCAISGDVRGFVDVLIGDLLCPFVPGGRSAWINKTDELLGLSQLFEDGAHTMVAHDDMLFYY